MRDLIIVLLLVFATQVHATAPAGPASPAAPAAPAGPKPESLEGKWLGFCSPNANNNTSKMCNYTFQKGTGEYKCEHFKDLRCSKKDTKTTTSAFRYTIQGSNDENLKLNIEYNDREDIRQEKSRAYVTGNVLRMQMYEIFRLPDAKDENLEAQGVIPFYEFTKGK